MKDKTSAVSQEAMVAGNQPQFLFSAALAIFFLGFLIAVPFRTFQLMTAVDATTGFYINGNTTVYFFNGLMVLLALLLFFLPLFQREMNAFANPQKSAVLPGIGLLFAGLAVTYVSATELTDLFGTMRGLDLSLASAMLGTVSGFLLILTSFWMFRRNFFASRMGLYLLLVPAWSCVHLLREFMEYNTVAGVSERILDIVTACAGTMTLFFLTALLCGVNTKRFHRLLVASSLITALFGMVSNLPRLLILLLGSPDLQQVLLSVHLPNLGLSVMSILLMVWYLTIAQREEVAIFHPRGANAEVLPDYVEGEHATLAQGEWDEDETLTTPTLLSPEEAVDELDSLIDSLIHQPTSEPEKETGSAAEDSAVAEGIVAPVGNISESISKESPKRLSVEQAKQSRLPTDENGYTILPTLAELISEETIDWDIDTEQ